MPDSELDACVRYEYAREIRDPLAHFGQTPTQIKDRNNWNKKHPTPSFVDGDEEMFVDLLYRQIDDFRDSPMIPPEFPKLAWQDLPVPLRQRIASRLQVRVRGISEAEWAVTLHPQAEAKFTELFGSTRVRLQIDWTQSDASLLDDFRQWLEANRPRNIRVSVQRGPSSLQDALNALGALRLRHFHNAVWASLATEAVLGKPLYSQAFGWDRAAAKAIRAFHGMFPKAGDPWSAKSKSSPRGRPTKARVEVLGLMEAAVASEVAKKVALEADPTAKVEKSRAAKDALQTLAAAEAKLINTLQRTK